MNKEAPVLVTGGSGFIASWIVKQLLEDGYKVNATVRNKSKLKKVSHLLEMQEAHPNQLRLFEADLLVDGSFAEAMKGCALVLHTASPFKLNPKDPQKELVEPALQGTRNVLQQAKDTPTVQRIVLTSSVVAIYGDAIEHQQTKSGVFTEQYWNETSSLKHQPYAYSKTLAEKEAWKIAEEQKQWDLVVINPGFVLGPSLSERTDGESASFMINLLSGDLKMGAPGLEFGCVDVRDVAKAHILAGTTPSASGRHIACEGSYKIIEMANMLRETFGDKYDLPSSELPKWLIYIFGPLTAGLSWKYIRRNVNVPLKFDNSYIKEDLGVTFRKIKDTLVDQAEQLEAIGALGM